jgi:elongation factor G
LVEPLMALEVEVPSDYLSGVLADLSVRRAEVGDVDALAGKLSARVSLERMFAYSTDLRSLSQGRGTFSMKPDGYRVVAKGREAELRAQLGGG